MAGFENVFQKNFMLVLQRWCVESVKDKLCDILKKDFHFFSSKKSMCIFALCFLCIEILFHLWSVTQNGSGEGGKITIFRSVSQVHLKVLNNISVCLN